MSAIEEIKTMLTEQARQYPEALVESQLQDVPRIAFQIDLVERYVGRDIALCDIGSGLGLFPAGCARRGMRATMMDDFRHPFADDQSSDVFADAPDAVYYEMTDDALELHQKLGVRIERRDPLEDGFGFPPESLDAVTTFDSMEHWHRSPKRLFASVMESLVPGGLLLIGVPNAVNLRKRITVPFGYGKWSQMSHWYETERFRGHVREPDVEDMLYIARDLDLTDIEILGRNWAGHLSGNRWMRRATALIDRPLQRRPSLCSDLYLIGRKKKESPSEPARAGRLEA